MMAYAWKSLGWFVTGVAVALGFLLVPLQVAAERKKLDRTVAQILSAKRDIRSLETEFDTRANLAQLERWNGDTLRLTAPVAGQFIANASALAQIDFRGAAPGQAQIQTAALVVPSNSMLPTMSGQALPDAAVPVPAVAVAGVGAGAGAQVVASASTPPLARVSAPAVSRPRLTPAVVRSAPVAVAVVAHIASVRPAVAHGKAQAVAMLDRKLLSDSTLGDLVNRAHAEKDLR